MITTVLRALLLLAFLGLLWLVAQQVANAVMTTGRRIAASL